MEEAIGGHHQGLQDADIILTRAHLHHGVTQGIVGQGMIIALQGDQDLSHGLSLHVMRGNTGRSRGPQVQERMVGILMMREIMNPDQGVLRVTVAVLQGLDRDPTVLASGCAPFGFPWKLLLMW